MKRMLPDPGLHLRESADFVSSSRLGRLALQYDGIPNLAIFIRDLLEEMNKLAQSCHLPEFTDHGLPHICSLVGRISEWTCLQQQGKEIHLCEKLTHEEGAILLLATMFHDIGMLSQNRLDMPDDYPEDQAQDYQDIGEFVRKTHVERMRGLVQRLFKDDELHGPLFDSIGANPPLDRAFAVAKTHTIWPWEPEGIPSLCERDQGLAAVLAVADLLDEDSSRCDTKTLLHHRQGNMRSLGHWIRHGLTLYRLNVDNGTVEVTLARPPGTDDSIEVIFCALRNHYRLAGLYNEALNKIHAGKITIDFNPNSGAPSVEASGLAGWEHLDGLNTKKALTYHVTKSFSNLALLREKTKDKLEALGAEGMEEMDLSIIDQIDFKDKAEYRRTEERTFYALLEERQDQSTPIH